MGWTLEIPELRALAAHRDAVRIPAELDVPLTPRVKSLIDSPPFRRLAHVSQLGLVALVYPGANHSRFEHSLGVYRLMLLFLQHLERNPRAVALLQPEQVELAIVAALLHDVAHWPFCHPIEDLRLPGIPIHESLAAKLLTGSELAERIRADWRVDPDDVARILCGETRNPGEELVSSLLSGPIDVDKMDYLTRDSLHCGVPYGRNFDQQRLIGSLCFNAAGNGLAITDKGRTAAEMLVFARYVMFSEVYWHHTVRAATAMLQRAFYELLPQLSLTELLHSTDERWKRILLNASIGRSSQPLIAGLFGEERVIYKRLAQYDILDQPELYKRLAGRPYPQLVEVARGLAARCSAALGESIPPTDLLLDAPPQEREIEFDLDVWMTKQNRYRRLGEISPVVRTLARDQFDDYVKRVRIYVHPARRERLAAVSNLPELLLSALGEIE